MAKKKTTRKKTPRATKKAPARKTVVRGRTQDLSPIEKKTLNLIETTAVKIHKKILSRGLPELKFPVRSLSNVTYDRRVGYFQLGRGTKVRALSVNTVKNFAQTLRLMSVSKEMVENDDFATKREAYLNRVCRPISRNASSPRSR